MVVIYETEVHRCSGGGRSSAQTISQIPNQLEVIFASNARAACNDYPCRLKIDFFGAFVLFDRTKTPRQYRQNQALDRDKDGTITKAEAVAKVQRQYEKGQELRN